MSPRLEKKPGCIANCLDVFGDKWTGLILRDLFDGSKRFSELEKSLTGISPRTLSQRLDRLEAVGIIAKSTNPSNSVRSEYNLTQKGRDCGAVLKQMAAWGAKYAEPSSS